MLAESILTEQPRRIAFVPRLRLYTERMLVDDVRARGGYREATVPVISLWFDYAGTRIRSSDDRSRFFVSEGDGMVLVERDAAGEARAQCLLETFGAVEMQCLEDYGPDPNSAADYVVQVGDNVHGFCSFTAYALPQLKSLGWQIEVAPDYPYQVVETDAPFYASVEPSEERSDWFNLELGVEVDGSRISLLPALLELLEDSAEGTTLQSLMRMPVRLRALPVAPNKYLTIPPERLKTLIHILNELYRGERLDHGALGFPGAQAGAIAELDDVLGDQGGGLCWEGATEVLDRGRGLLAPGIAPTAAARGLKATLRPYQQQGLDWLQHLRTHDVAGVLADDMGLGKTLQTIAHLATEKESGRSDRPSLIVVPTSLVGNWQRELKKFAPHLEVCVLHGPGRHRRRSAMASADVVLTTYPLLIRDREQLEAFEFHYVILDEAQAIKNNRSQASRAVRVLKSRHRLCLTGTPVENNLDELWSIFDFLMPGLLGSADRFRDRFRHPIEREGNEAQLELLRELVSPFILRRMKESVARELPPKTEIVRPVELDGDQRDLYESIRVAAHAEVRSAIRKKGLSASTITILDALMKLRQVCCDPRLVSVPSARRVQRSAKVEMFFELLEKQLGEGRRVLVFSQFTQMLALIAQGLQERALKYVQLTGSTVDRNKPVRAFEDGEADVFLISLKAGGTGLNLTSADTVIHYDPWWNPAAQAQATDRAYRIGQTRPVFVYNLIVAGSVEENMLRLQQRKQHLADTILGTPVRRSSSLSEDEIEDLFAPLGEE